LREDKKEKKSNELNQEKDEILEKKEDAYKETQKMEALCQEQEDERRQREAKDQEALEAEQAKIKEKMDMDLAAKYVQRKWNWFQTEGKFLAKKRKGQEGKEI